MKKIISLDKVFFKINSLFKKQDMLKNNIEIEIINNNILCVETLIKEMQETLAEIYKLKFIYKNKCILD
jgi:hypothetical protein